MLIIDEVQNIEKVPNEDEERAKILFDVIQVFKNDIKPKKIIVCGPRLENLDKIIKKWFGEDAKSVSEELPSVLNITYTFKPQGSKLLFLQYISKKIVHSIEIIDSFRLKAKILKRQIFGEEEYNLIARIINQNKQDGNIIFADRTSSANKIAFGIASKLDDYGISKETESFIKFVENSINPKYALLETLKKGVAYHHAKMPAHIRMLVEKLFIGRHLNTIVATTTLMQGVNLPAKNIIIKSPKVGRAENLTGYEFTNLKGRAGRLMQDFIGRALIINEANCTDVGIDLDISQQKELIVGYAKRFQEEKEVIKRSLISNIEMNDNTNNDLVTYIRNMCFRYPKVAINRLNEVGIILSEEIIKNIMVQISNLEVPSSICLNNFYWDPLILNKLYLSFKSGEWPLIPKSIISSAQILSECILKMAEFAPFYYNRYIRNLEINERGRRKIYSLAIYAENYGRGFPIKDVINTFNFPIKTSEDIEERFSDIQTKVVYGIPKLLKPLFQINDFVYNEKTSSVLSFIEVGGMDSRLRTLIEIGIPRETAITLLQNFSNSNFISADSKVNSVALKEFIRQAKDSDKLSKWHKLLIQDI